MSSRKQKKKAVVINNHGIKLDVIVMAEADGYAMVRVKGCAPFCVNIKKQVTFIDK
jgi:hypothetical protein